ncbi:MAG: hypothetical protein CFE24_11565 [Flavobacterium sp. BFFFF2]|nr:MAG: hypothetical protein CFE24_11565 [Flavobacterium sp. BFFFF2]
MKGIYIYLLFLLLALCSCDKDDQQVSYDTSNSFDTSSPIASLISRVTQYETSKDNVLDGTNSCAVKLPVTFYINQHYNVTISNPAQYAQVVSFKNEYNNDDDVVHFNFPITLVLHDYSQRVVANEQQWQALKASFGNDSAYNDIDCINFVYPVKVNVYDTASQIAQSITLQNDQIANQTLHQLSASQILNFVFPLSVVSTGNQAVAISNLSELETNINNAAATCNAGSTTSSLSDILQQGNWKVSYYFDNHEHTNLFNPFTLSFQNTGHFMAISGSGNREGEWLVYTENTSTFLHLDCDQAPINALEADWKVIEVTNSFVRLKQQEGNQVKYLSLSKM